MNIYKDTNLIESIKELLTSYVNNIDWVDIEPCKLYSHYYNFIFRLIFSSLRVVHKSTNFSDSYNNLSTCEQNQVNQLLTDIEQGKNLQQYQSQQVLTYYPNKLDDLLMDWGIFHLHLTPNRSGKLIFAVFNKDNAYLLDIKDHNSFADKDLLQILDNTWSELIEHYKVPNNIQSLHGGYEGADLKRVRKNGFDTFQTINGRILSPLGGGITSASTSGLAQGNRSKLFRLLEQFPDKSYKLDNDNMIIIENINDPKDRIYICFSHLSCNKFGTLEYLQSIS